MRMGERSFNRREAGLFCFDISMVDSRKEEGLYEGCPTNCHPLLSRSGTKGSSAYAGWMSLEKSVFFYLLLYNYLYKS